MTLFSVPHWYKYGGVPLAVISSSNFDMFFYIVCALFLLNAFTTEAQPTTPCEDQGGEMFCLGPKHAGQCSSPDFAPIAHQFCAKTCGLC